MINTIMDYLNNYFDYDYENTTVSISGDTITIDDGTFSNDYLSNGYIRLYGSLLNDGVYKVSNATDTVITLTETLTTEDNVKLNIWRLRPPKAFLDLVDEISTHVTANKSKPGVSSEKIDDYSISFSGNGGWESSFKDRLSNYRRLKWQ